MATNTTIAIPATQLKSLDTGLYNITSKPALPGVANGDRIVLMTFGHAARVSAAHLRQTAAMGAAATMKLQRNSGGVYTARPAATPAATAGSVGSAAIGPLDFIAGDTVEILVGGGALTAGIVEVDVIAQRA
ncbi:hypothetical protein [Sphingomonas sp.]|uniref:hypothetical protein n=1 Tax=Sphingomonas sp. TaxID=28214 RepID=UPI003B3A55F3